MVCARKDRAVGAALVVIILSVVCGPALGRDPVKLVVHPQKASAEAGKYSLLPPQASLADGDAVPWYEKAVKALPDKKAQDQARQYLNTPFEKLPADQVEQLLKRYVESFKCVAQAVKCKECKWPAWAPGTQVANLPEYSRLGSAVRLWARYEIAQEDYEGAILAMQIGFGMGRHFTQVPTLVQFTTGAAIDAVMCKEVQEFVQAGEAPNLYAALAALPRPFTEVEKVIEDEKKAGASQPSVMLGGALFEKRTPADGVRILAKLLEVDLAALQCVEAIRSYAASHGGQLPQALADIKEVSIPNDPMTGAAFRYTRAGATGVLESPAPAGGFEQDAIRYEITVQK
jgi:tetratricopeptide (TPR) repeat protein